MKNTILIIACLAALTSCGSSPTVTVTTAGGDNIAIGQGHKFGGRGAVVAQAGGARVVLQENYEDSFREGSKTARFGLGALVVGNAVSNAADAVTSINATNKATETTLGIAAQKTSQAQNCSRCDKSHFRSCACSCPSYSLNPHDINIQSIRS